MTPPASQRDEKLPDLRMGDSARADAREAVDKMNGPPPGGDNNLFKLNLAAFLGERYAGAMLDDLEALRRHVGLDP